MIELDAFGNCPFGFLVNDGNAANIASLVRPSIRASFQADRCGSLEEQNGTMLF
jgi:hypothetical protein